MTTYASRDSNELSHFRSEFPEIPFDRYRIVQHIGKGAFSKVFLAYTPEFQRRAIKRIRLTAKPHQLLKEIEFLRRLEGKSNIVQVKEIRFCESTLQTTVITSYADTDDFKSVILDFTPREIQAYMRSILTALSHLEKLKILHRDIKPGNFLFERKTGKGLLIDFGLAQTLREVREFPLLRGQGKSRRGAIDIDLAKVVEASNKILGDAEAASRSYIQLPYNASTANRLPIAGYVNKDQTYLRPLPPSAHSGTHGYRAPEILAPVRNQDCKIDTWSVGVILIQMLTGKTSLFRGNPTVDIYELMAIRAIIGVDRFIQGMSRLKADFSLTAGAPMPQAIALEELAEWYNPDLLAVIPASCFDLCRKLLEFDPERRLSASQALAHPFCAMDSNSLPNYRFQDGAHSKSLLSFTGFVNFHPDNPALIPEEDSLQAVRQRSMEIAARLGICKITGETLSDEYGSMTPSAMIPLPRDLRKQVQKLLTKYNLDKTVQGPTGIIVERHRPSDYIYPSSTSVQDLSICAGCTLARPRLAAAPGSHARPCAVEERVREEWKRVRASRAGQEAQGQAQAQASAEPGATGPLLASEAVVPGSTTDVTRQVLAGSEGQESYTSVFRRCYDEAWEAGNRDKESFERAVRCTAVRRHLDPWVQPLKALDKELRMCQREVRKAAEEYRRLVVALIPQQGLEREKPKERPKPAAQPAQGGEQSEESSAFTPAAAVQAVESALSLSFPALPAEASGAARSGPGARPGAAGSPDSRPDPKRPAVRVSPGASGTSGASQKTVAAPASQIRTLPSYRFPRDFTLAQVSRARLTSFIVHSQMVERNSAGQDAALDLAARAWAAVEQKHRVSEITRRNCRKLYQLTLKGARLSTISHRLALSGPDSWEAKGEIFFINFRSRVYEAHYSIVETTSHIYEFTNKLSQAYHHCLTAERTRQECQQRIKELQSREEQLRDSIAALEAQMREILLAQLRDPAAAQKLNTHAHPSLLSAVQALAAATVAGGSPTSPTGTAGTGDAAAVSAAASAMASAASGIDYSELGDLRIPELQEACRSRASLLKHLEFAQASIKAASARISDQMTMMANLNADIQSIKDYVAEKEKIYQEQKREYYEVTGETPRTNADWLYMENSEEDVITNSSDLWSEIISVSDEGSEARPDFAPLGVYDPNELQEPYFENLDAIKAALHYKDVAAERRKSRREMRRRLEALVARKRDPILEQLHSIQTEIVAEREKLYKRLDASDASEAQAAAQAASTAASAAGAGSSEALEVRHNELLPRRADTVCPSLLSQAVAIKTLSRKYEILKSRVPGGAGLSAEASGEPVKRRAAGQDVGTASGSAATAAKIPVPPGVSGAPTAASVLKAYARNSLAYLQTKLQVERKAHTLLSLISSPYGRYLVPFQRIFSPEYTGPAPVNSFVQMCTKADVYIPEDLTQLLNTLQTLSDRYLHSDLGKKDVLLVAAACQSELDLRAQNAAKDEELQHLGLSRRPPNLEYLLLMMQRLAPLVAPFDEARSTSAVSGLAKSATHRSLADPARTSVRYPQTCKYIQTVLEQVMRRFVTLPGVIDEVYNETLEGISAIKGRILEGAVVELILKFQKERASRLAIEDKSGRDAASIASSGTVLRQLLRLKRCIEILGAGTVYDILRGVVYPLTIIRGMVGDPPASGNVFTMDREHGAASFLTDEDVRKINQILKEGSLKDLCDPALVQKLDASAERRKLLLQPRYGGMHHARCLQRATVLTRARK